MNAKVDEATTRKNFPFPRIITTGLDPVFDFSLICPTIFRFSHNNEQGRNPLVCCAVSGLLRSAIVFRGFKVQQ